MSKSKPLSLDSAPPMKYSYRTRIGNWSEEWDLDEIKIRDSKMSREIGNIRVLDSEGKKNMTVRKAALSFLPKGQVEDGARVMLHSQLKPVSLACNVSDKIPGPDEIYGVSGTKALEPITRNVFRIEKIQDPKKGRQDPTIRYGDKFRLVASQRIFGENKKFYLVSNPTSLQSHAKLSGKQEVLLTSKLCNASLWEFEHIDPRVRFDTLGEAVKVAEPLLLKHTGTSQWLAVDDFQFVSNMYGQEHEIFVHSFLKQAKTHNLIAEQEGRTTIDIPLRGQQPQNAWAVVAGKSPHDYFDENELDKPINIDEVMRSLHHAVVSSGWTGLLQLRNMFRKVDYKAAGTLDAEDVKWSFRNIGLELSPQEIHVLLDNFDTNKSGQVDHRMLTESLNIFTGPERVNKISHLYRGIAQKHGGKVTQELLGRLFDATRHPEVLSRRKSEKQVFEEFIKAWGPTDPLAPLTETRFVEFYQDMSACLPEEMQFESCLFAPYGL